WRFLEVFLKKGRPCGKTEYIGDYGCSVAESQICCHYAPCDAVLIRGRAFGWLPCQRFLARPKYTYPCRIPYFFRMKSMRSRIIHRALLAAVLAIASTTAIAADWPQKSVRVIVAYPPGGVSDSVTRAIADKLSERLGVSFVVENKG